MNYEMMVAANAKTSEALAVKIDKVFKESEASGVKVEKMGKRMLAYPIAKQNEADFFVYNFEAGGEAISKISGMLRLEQDAVLRYLITKVKVPRVSRIPRVDRAGEGKDEQRTEEKAPKVTVRTTSNVAGATSNVAGATSNVIKTKVVAKKTKKVVKGSKGKRNN